MLIATTWTPWPWPHHQVEFSDSLDIRRNSRHSTLISLHIAIPEYVTIRFLPVRDRTWRGIATTTATPLIRRPACVAFLADVGEFRIHESLSTSLSSCGFLVSNGGAGIGYLCSWKGEWKTLERIQRFLIGGGERKLIFLQLWSRSGGSRRC